MKQPLALIILDGFGCREETKGNAIAAARTPHLDHLMACCPHTRIGASLIGKRFCAFGKVCRKRKRRYIVS